MIPNGAAPRTDWRQALSEGRHGQALTAWTMWRFGSAWTLWGPEEALRPRIAAQALRFCRKHTLDAALAHPHGQHVEWAIPPLVHITEHLAHDHFGRPRSWRDDPNPWFVGMEAAMKTIEEHRKLARDRFADGVMAAISDCMNARRQAAALELALIAQAGQRRGLSPKQIAQCMGRKQPDGSTTPIPRRTVERWLARDLGSQPLPEGIVLPFPIAG